MAKSAGVDVPEGWLDDIPTVDGLIKEYLLFKSYRKTYEAFEEDRRKDSTYNMNADELVQKCFQHLRDLDLEAITKYWQTLDRRVFCHLPPEYTDTIIHLGRSLKRAFVIMALKKKQASVVKLFYKTFYAEFSMEENRKHWQDWFALPYISDPSTHPLFQSYFNKEWMLKFSISLRNFFHKAFSELPPPKLLAIKVWKKQRHQLRREIVSLNRKLEAAQMRIKSLEKVNLDLLHGSSPYPPLRPLITKSALSDDTSDSEDEIAHSLVPSPTSERSTFRIHSQQVFGATGDIKLCTISERGTRLAFTVSNGSATDLVQIWDVSEAPTSLGGLTFANVHCLKFGQHRDTLLICAEDRGNPIITLYNIDTRKAEWSVKGPKGFPRFKCLECSIHQPIFALGSCRPGAEGAGHRGVISLYQMHGLHSVTSEPLHVEINEIVFNHNGRLVICACTDGSIQFFDVNNLTRLDMWSAHKGSVLKVALSGDTNSLTTIGGDRIIRNWDLKFSDPNRLEQVHWNLNTKDSDNPVWEFEMQNGKWCEFSDACSKELEQCWHSDRTRAYRYVDDEDGESFAIDLSSLTRVSAKSGKKSAVRRRTHCDPLLSLGPGHYLCATRNQTEVVIFSKKHSNSKGIILFRHPEPITTLNWNANRNLLITTSKGNCYVQLLERAKRRKQRVARSVDNTSPSQSSLQQFTDTYQTL